jgi:hypothetical protein
MVEIDLGGIKSIPRHMAEPDVKQYSMYAPKNTG